MSFVFLLMSRLRAKRGGTYKALFWVSHEAFTLIMVLLQSEQDKYVACQSEKTVKDESPAAEGIANSVRKVMTPFPRSICVLDIGCRTGYAMGEMKKLGFWLVRGVDINEKYVKECIKKDLNVYCVDVHNVHTTRNQIGTFDFVWMRHTLEHLHSPKEALFNLGYTVMEQGSWIHIIVPAKSEVEKYHYFPYDTTKRVEAPLKDAGFKIIYTKHVPRTKGLNYQDEFWCMAQWEE